MKVCDGEAPSPARERVRSPNQNDAECAKKCELGGRFLLSTQPTGHQIFGAAGYDQFLSGGT